MNQSSPFLLQTVTRFLHSQHLSTPLKTFALLLTSAGDAILRDGNVGVSVGLPIPNIAIEWIAMNFATDFHGTPRTNPTDFGDPLTFALVQPACQIFLISINISIST